MVPRRRNTVRDLLHRLWSDDRKLHFSGPSRHRAGAGRNPVRL